MRFRCLVMDHDDTTVNSTATIHFPSFLAYLKLVRPEASYTLEDYFRKNFDPGIMALFTLVVLARLIFSSGPIGYDTWAGIFSTHWMKALTFALIVSLAWHAWIGMRDIWMDYVKPVGLRLTLHVLTIVWLLGCAGWAFQVLWRL